MAKIYELNADNDELLCEVGKALSSPVRIKILKLLYYNSYNIGEISEKLGIPASSAGVHIKILENARLINTEIHPGSRGAMKLCSRKNDLISIRLSGNEKHVNQFKSISMPVGSYTDCEVVPTCGLADENDYIGVEDNPSTFFLPERMNAQIVWSGGGFLEYKFPNPLNSSEKPQRLILSFEACSEAPNFRDDWKSDISIRCNGVRCGIWNSLGDFGSRRGRLNPSWWEDGATQYGMLVNCEITTEGTYINGEQVSDVSVYDLDIQDKPYVVVKIGNDPDSENVGGFNIFGEKFGDYEQNIILSIEY